ncbi:diaminopimelate epimerase [Pelagibacteraceae bacterium]|nr:diaminopimelate epimerase [Pelagibacteraceae bacterium]
MILDIPIFQRFIGKLGYISFMQNIEFIKMHGLGNDFVIIDKRSKDITINEDLIKKLSNRKTGAGCDQLITIKESNNDVDAEIEIFNPSGDRAEACGNGTRCIARILFDENKNKDLLKIQSDAGILEAKKEGDNISVNMGEISTVWDRIPLSSQMDTMEIPIFIKGYSNGVAVNVGNPHIVFFGESISETNLDEIGPSIENHKFFPMKTNVELVEIINSTSLKMRVWERGVGITLACGSGACASVYAAWKKNLTDNKVEVILEKGSLYINVDNNKAIMTGPTEISYYGNLEI